MTVPAIEIEGGRKLRKAFKDIGDDMSDVKALHKELGEIVASAAKTKVPVRSGRLKRNIRSSGTKTAAAVKSGNDRKAGPASIPYAPIVHFGWARRGIRPQPYLYEALDERRQQVINRYENEVRSIIRRAF